MQIYATFKNVFPFYIWAKNLSEFALEYTYRGSPTSTVSTSTNSSSTHFWKGVIKFNLYDFASKSPSCTNSTNTILHQSPPLILNGIWFALFPALVFLLFANPTLIQAYFPFHYAMIKECLEFMYRGFLLVRFLLVRIFN